MSVRCNASKKIRFVHVPKDGDPGVSVVVVPSTVVLNTAVSATRDVTVYVYRGGEIVSPESMSFLSDKQFSQLAKGLIWSFGGSTSDGGFSYRLNYISGNDINLTVPFYVTVDGVSYHSAFCVQTVKDGTNGSGSDGRNGVWVPPMMLWSDYPDDYYFQAGDPSSGDVRLDMVLVKAPNGNLIPYHCLQSHIKADSLFSPETDTEFWAPADAGVYKCLATELLAAQNARIDFLSGQAIRVGNGASMCGYFGAPTANGAILYSGADSEADASFLIDQNGKTYHGGTSGQRIEIDPASKRMLVYGSDGNLCAIHSGDDLDWQTVWNTVSSGGSVSQTPAAKTLQGSKTEYVTLTSLGITPTADGTLKISIPAFTLKANGAMIKADSGMMMSMYVSELCLEVLAGLKVVAQYFLGAIMGNGDTVNETAVTTARTVTCAALAGTAYSVRLRYVSNINGSASFSTAPVTRTLEVSTQMCHYGRNGWCVVRSNQDYSYCIFDSAGKMHQRTVSGGVIMFDTDTSGKHF